MFDGSRHEARERAVSLLYESEIKDVSIDDVLTALSLPPEPYVGVLLESASKQRDRIDEELANAAEGWTVDRMAMVDRNILRVAVAELLTQADVPTAVIIDEAVELAKELSTDDSGRFINGILSTVASRVRSDA